MLIEVFRKLLVLFFCCIIGAFGQTPDNLVTIEFSQSVFLIERPFTISVIVPNSENRPSVNFPDIPGFNKRGITTSITTTEIDKKTVVNQVVTQEYRAKAPGQYKVPPFAVTVNGFVARSEGLTLTVRPSAAVTTPGTVTNVAPTAVVVTGAAFLKLFASKSIIYAGEGVALTLSFCVADDYPYELSFTALDRQLQDIVKKVRPANAWEENANINELKAIPTLIGGRKFREFRLYQAVYFPLSAQPLRLPAVSLWLTRPRPKIGPPSSQPETVVFTSKPLTVNVRQLPAHPLRGKVPVGTFRVVENLERSRVGVGQSVRYTFAIEGEGNIATLPAPTSAGDAQITDVDVFPPEERQTVNRAGGRVTGRKTFAYFLVPHQNGSFPLTDRFQWIYFSPESARYDTLRSQLQLQVGGAVATSKNGSGISALVAEKSVESVSSGTGSSNSIYAGIDKLDSTQQPLNGPVLIRAVANVLIVVMLLGMLVVFFRR